MIKKVKLCTFLFANKKITATFGIEFTCFTNNLNLFYYEKVIVNACCYRSFQFHRLHR